MAMARERVRRDSGSSRYAWTTAGIRNFVADHTRTKAMALRFFHDLGLRFNSKGECIRVVPL